MRLVKIYPKSATSALWLALAAWLLVVGAGVHALTLYSYAPGPESNPPVEWPAGQGPLPTVGAATLVMFLHPQCPCSRASVEELAVLMAKARGDLRARVFFYRAHDAAPGWEQTDLWRSASAIPGVEVAVDNDGLTALAFHAEVSGAAEVYTSTGRLVFSGGITPARGHQGDSDGRRAILALLTNTPPAVQHSPVFGCYLRGASAASDGVNSQ